MTKSDLSDDAVDKLTEIEKALPGVDAVLTSAFENDAAAYLAQKEKKFKEIAKINRRR